MQTGGELYTGIMVFMIFSLKKSITFAACPEYKISGHRLSMQIEDTLETLFESPFHVKAVITDNHSTNVLSFNILRSMVKRTIS